MQELYPLSTLLASPFNSSRLESSVGLFDNNLASEYLLCGEYDGNIQAQPRTPPQTNIKKDKKPRLAVACLFCRKRKIKCDGQTSCIHCQKRGIDCVYPTIPRKKRSNKQLQQVEDENEMYNSNCSGSKFGSKSTIIAEQYKVKYF